MKSLQNVIDAVLAHLRTWPAFSADPDSKPGGPTIPPASAAAALGVRPPTDRTLEVRTPEGWAPRGRSCYRVEPIEWGSDHSGPATRPAEEAAGRRGGDHPTPRASARRRASSPLGANALPSPQGLLTCASGAAERRP